MFLHLCLYSNFEMGEIHVQNVVIVLIFHVQGTWFLLHSMYEYMYHVRGADLVTMDRQISRRS
jgi:hypothetical protein